MRVCPQYLSGQFNGINYYYALNCGSGPVPLSSSEDLDYPQVCNSADPCVTVVAVPPEPAKITDAGLHAVHASVRSGIISPCTAAHAFRGDRRQRTVTLDTVVKARRADDIQGARVLVRLLHVLIYPPGFDPIPLTIGQQTTENGPEVDDILIPQGEKYYKFIFGGITYHVLLARE
jgi:hypothetical protein